MKPNAILSQFNCKWISAFCERNQRYLGVMPVSSLKRQKAAHLVLGGQVGTRNSPHLFLITMQVRILFRLGAFWAFPLKKKNRTTKSSLKSTDFNTTTERSNGRWQRSEVVAQGILGLQWRWLVWFVIPVKKAEKHKRFVFTKFSVDLSWALTLDESSEYYRNTRRNRKKYNLPGNRCANLMRHPLPRLQHHCSLSSLHTHPAPVILSVPHTALCSSKQAVRLLHFLCYFRQHRTVSFSPPTQSWMQPLGCMCTESNSCIVQRRQRPGWCYKDHYCDAQIVKIKTTTAFRVTNMRDVLATLKFQTGLGHAFPSSSFPTVSWAITSLLNAARANLCHLVLHI